jgi:hypothetical protein
VTDDDANLRAVFETLDPMAIDERSRIAILTLAARNSAAMTRHVKPNERTRHADH